MATAAQVLDLARADLGTTESPPNTNRVLFRDGMNLWVWMIGRDVTGSSWPWCGAWVSRIFAKAGMGDQVRFTYCPTGRATFIGRHQYFTTPQPGDVAFYDWEGDSIVDHTGIVEEYRPRSALHPTSTVVVIEGNTLPPGARGNQGDGGGVFRRERPMYQTRGFGRPLYNATPPSPAPLRPLPRPGPPASGDDDLTPDQSKKLDEAVLYAADADNHAKIAEAHAAVTRLHVEGLEERLSASLDAKLAKLLEQIKAPV